MLTLDAVSVRQGAFSLTADLTVETGAQVAVLGPSGAGKSTLLGAIAGFVPVAGRVFCDGRDITDLAPGERPVSILFQDNNLFPHLTAAQNVGLGIRPDLRLSPSQNADVATALDHVGLAEFANRKPGSMSGGQQSRVALARILVQARPLILLDEPFAALGPALKSELMGLVRDMAQRVGATCLTVTHHPDDARQWMDQAILVAEGRAESPKPTGAFFANPPKALADYLGDGPKTPKRSDG